MTARTAPLTMTQEQWVRYDYARRESNQALPEGALSPDAVALWDELAATRAQLAAVTGENDRLREAAAYVVAQYEALHVSLPNDIDFLRAALSPTQPTPTEGNES